MAPTGTRGRHHRSSAQPSRTKNKTHSHGQGRSSRARLRSDSPVPRPSRQSRSKGRSQDLDEGSPNTLTGRELSRALNKASEKGTQGKEM